MDNQGLRPGFDMSSTMLKNIAIVTMFIDHIGAALLESWLAYGNTMGIDRHFFWLIDRLLRSIGRLAFPLFIFVLIEGFFYTRSRSKYLIRLTLFCLISEIPFDLAFRQHYMKMAAGQLLELGYQNVFFTLAIGFAAIWIIETLRPRNICLRRKNAGIESSFVGERKKEASVLAEADPMHTESVQADSMQTKFAQAEPAQTVSENMPAEHILLSLLRIALCMAVAAGACYLAAWMKTDYSWSGVLAIVLAYLIRLTGAYDLELMAIVGALTLASQIECIAILDVFLIRHYHGRKGSGKNRWFFYIFYPAHLLVLGLIRMCMGV